MKRSGIILTLAFALQSLCMAQEPLSDVGDVRFSRHVMPLLSRLGCNGGTCHGSIQGQNGFRLSLYGAEPKADYEHLVREFAGRRIHIANPDASLVLLKATGRAGHGGGKRTDSTSVDYQLLRKWIADGARFDQPDDSRVTRLDIASYEPAMRVGDEVTLQVTASFADGTQEDVSGLSVFESRDDSIVSVDRAGHVRAVAIGDTAVVVHYRGAVAFTTLAIAPETSRELPDVKPHNFVDKHVLKKLRQLSIQPAELCDDATFLRRASLDVAGRLPTPDEVRAFLADKSSNKRTELIEHLLKQPGYSALWATRFMDIMRLSGFHKVGFPLESGDEYRAYSWIRARMQENTPYDEFVERILTATGREGRTMEAWVDELAAVALESIQGAPPKSYAARRTMDLFWQRRMTEDVDYAVRVGHAFLGLRLQCAQCHRHPSDVWTQDDLLSFSNFFMRVPGFSAQINKIGAPKQAPQFDLAKKKVEALAKAQKVTVKSMKDLQNTAAGYAAREIDVVTEETIDGPMRGKRRFTTVTSALGTQSSEVLRLLGETEDVLIPKDGSDRRTLVMDWLRRPDNQFFAKAIVNRVWAHYLGRGIVDPPDDLSPLNPASHPELLNELCRGFIDNKYDLKWLHRTILASRTYQQSSALNATNREDRRNYASFYLRRLPAEVFIDSINQVTGITPEYKGARRGWTLDFPAGTRLLEGASLVNHGDRAPDGFALDAFGRPLREVEVQCDCERDDNPSMLQALFLANHPNVRKRLSDPKGRVAEIVKRYSSDNERIEEAFLCSVSRLPTDAERAACVKYLNEDSSPEEGLAGILWALMNSNEFTFNH